MKSLPLAVSACHAQAAAAVHRGPVDFCDVALGLGSDREDAERDLLFSVHAPRTVLVDGIPTGSCILQ